MRPFARSVRKAPPPSRFSLFRSLCPAKPLCNRLDGDGFALARASLLDLDLARGNAARADDYLPRETDQVGGRKLGSGPLVGVVVENIAACRRQRRVQFVRNTIAVRIARFHVDQAEVERRDAFGPDDAVVVV